MLCNAELLKLQKLEQRLFQIQLWCLLKMKLVIHPTYCLPKAKDKTTQ